MTCRDGDKESLLYFDSHNKFMTQFLRCGGGGSGQVESAIKFEKRLKQEGTDGVKQEIPEQRLSN